MRATVHVGYACNNRCVFCAQGDLHAGGERRVSDEEVRRRIEHAREAADALTFVGGEPTLRDELAEWASLARERGFRTVQVQTNGRRLAYRRYMDRLVQAGVDDLDVSLHGHAAGVHDYHVDVDGAFEQTTEGIANAVGAGLQVGITTVLTRSNGRHLAELVRLGTKLGAQRFHLAAAVPRGRAEGRLDAVVPRYALLAEALGEALDVARRLGVAAVVSGIPVCFLGEHAAASRDLLGGIEPDDAVSRAHGGSCGTCTWNVVCPGPSTEVVRRRGEADLVARADAPPVGLRAPAALRAAATRITGTGTMEAVRPERIAERPPWIDVARAKRRELGKPAAGFEEARGRLGRHSR